MDFKERFKKETGKSVNGTILERLIYLQYSQDYVNWLEEQLRLHVVSQRSELLSEDYENKLKKGVKELKEAMEKRGIKLP